MDVIANSLTKIRNAVTRKAVKTEVIKSGVVENILKVMKREGYISDYKNSEDNPYSYSIQLKYVKGKSSIAGLKRISKLSRRIYSTVDKLPTVYNNYGISVISTSKGVLTDKEAKALGVGGEVLCYIL